MLSDKWKTLVLSGGQLRPLMLSREKGETLVYNRGKMMLSMGRWRTFGGQEGEMRYRCLVGGKETLVHSREKREHHLCSVGGKGDTGAHQSWATLGFRLLT